MAEITKRKKGQVLNNSERQLILNLMNYLKDKNSGKSISEIIREISKATGCSERTIYKIKKEGSKGTTVSTNRTRLRKKENKNSRNVKYDSFVKSSIRKIIQNYFLQNSSPTLNTILCLVNNDPDLPNFKRSTLHTLLKEIGFVYEQKGKKSVLTERRDSIRSRQAYLRDMRKFRSENRWIVYTGETIFSLLKKEIQKDVPLERPRDDALEMASKAVSTVFINAPDLMSGTTLVFTVDSGALGTAARPENMEASRGVGMGLGRRMSEGAIVGDESVRVNGSLCGDMGKAEGRSALCRQNSGRELRLMVMHAGSKDGFIQDADLVVLTRKRAEDAENYRHWFLEKLLPRIPENSVIVTDNNAAYHKASENYPDDSWKKKQIKNWLISKSVRVEHLKQKKELLSVVNEVWPLHSTSRKVNEMARERGIIILSLPPFHYELNPLNLIWAQIKYYVKSNLKSFKVKKIKQLVREGFYSISQVSWMSYVHHVREIEDLLWTMDELQKRSEDFSLGQQSVGQKETKMPETLNKYL